MVRLPARMRTWGKRGYGLLEDRVVVLRMCREQFAAAGGWAADDAASAARAASAFVARLICHVSTAEVSVLRLISVFFRDLGARRRLGAQSAVLRRVS